MTVGQLKVLTCVGKNIYVFLKYFYQILLTYPQFPVIEVLTFLIYGHPSFGFIYYTALTTQPNTTYFTADAPVHGAYVLADFST